MVTVVTMRSRFGNQMSKFFGGKHESAVTAASDYLVRWLDQQKLVAPVGEVLDQVRSQHDFQDFPTIDGRVVSVYFRID